MELHSHTVGKKLWNYLRVAFFMMRKGLISKRRFLLVDLDLIMKKGKLLGKSLGKNLPFYHLTSRSPALPHGFSFSPALQEYEFSCNNSPIPVVFSRSGNASKRRPLNSYFPCIISGGVEDEPEEPSTPVVTAMTPWRIQYSPQSSCQVTSYNLASGEKLTPLPSPPPFSTIRISNYSSEEDEEDMREGGRGSKVDDEAEEFIRKFYEQLRGQSRVGLLEFQAMLATGI